MTATLLRLRWPLIGALAALVIAVPTASADAPAVSEDEKQKHPKVFGPLSLSLAWPLGAGVWHPRRARIESQEFP